MIAGGDFPAWLTTEGESDFDRLASQAIEPNLKTEQPVSLQLKELLADTKNVATRRREGKTLSIRSLVYVGDYEPAIAVLNNKDDKLLWPTALDELKLAVARNPKTAAQVRAAFEKARGPEAGRAMYRILWGYSLADLKEGADRELINDLESEALDMRVVSFLTLQSLTGASHGYQPEAPEIKRKQAVNAWKLRIGKITPRSTPAAKGKAAKSG